MKDHEGIEWVNTAKHGKAGAAKKDLCDHLLRHILWLRILLVILREVHLRADNVRRL